MDASLNFTGGIQFFYFVLHNRSSCEMVHFFLASKEFREILTVTIYFYYQYIGIVAQKYHDV